MNDDHKVKPTARKASGMFSGYARTFETSMWRRGTGRYQAMFVGDYSLVSITSSYIRKRYVAPEWTEDFQSPHMCIFAIHVVCDNDDLQNICGHRLPGRQGQPRIRKEYGLERGYVQAVAILVWLRRDVKGIPSIRLLQSNNSDVL